jgi:protein SCO1/2
MLPAVVLGLWLTSTLGWWAFAFAPAPSAPPAWLSAARAACFGAVESGLPAAHGWLLLIMAPASLLAGVVVLWGSEIVPSVRRVARSRLGACALAVIGLAAVVEGQWVVAKMRVGLEVAAWDRDTGIPAELPATYPRQSAAAPEFALVDQAGETISLGRFQGKPVVLTFVFAHCQAMCPLVVQNVKRAAAGADSAVLLVTLDPWRDTPSTLAAIARQWEVPASFHVLSSPRVAEVLRVVTAYQVPYERNETSGDIAHPGLVFLIDEQGRLAYRFNNPPPAWIREGLKRLARSGGNAG